MKRRRLLAVGLAIVPLAFAAACSFPDVTFAPGADDDAGAEGGGVVDPGPGDAGAEGSLPDDVEPGGHLADAATADKDATTAIDAAGCTSCDCDGDGFQRLDLDAGCDGGAGPIDCDDTIAAIKPGQGFILNATWPSTQHTPEFDWDCSGAVTKQYPYNGTCAALSACSNGFQGNPPCGGTAAYLTCKQPLNILGATCSTDKAEPSGERIQGCR
jgi:hypothetical protein